MLDFFERSIARFAQMVWGALEWVFVAGILIWFMVELRPVFVIGAGFWGLMWLIRVHWRQWGTPTAPPLVRATFCYALVLFGLFLLAQLPLPIPVWRFTLWASLGYGGTVLYLDGTSPKRNGPPALPGQHQEVRHATLFDFLSR